MYVFITYGEPGWRGVQVRNIEVAKHFKKSEVLFINGVDSSFVKQEGFKCITVDTSLINPDNIKFPPRTKAVIFADLPTNELYNLSLFYKAKAEGLPIVIFDNLMRRGQTKEGVFRKLIDNSDLFFFNGLDFMNSENTSKVKIIPPLPEYKKNPLARKKLVEKYNLNTDTKILFASGYESESKRRVNDFYQKLNKRFRNFVLILSDNSISELKRVDKKIIVPNLGRDGFMEHLDGADLILSKFGYLQLLEILALKKPTVIAGKGGYVLETSVLDRKLQETLPYAKDSNELYKIVYSLLSDNRKMSSLKRKIDRLHNSGLCGARMAAEIIKKKKFKKKKWKMPLKKSLILLNSEIKRANNFINKHDYLFVWGIVTSTSKPGPMSVIKRPDEEILEGSLDDLLPSQSDEILPHAFRQIFLFSRRKYDGYLDILPWYKDVISQFENIINTSDEIYITKQALKLIKNMIPKNKLKKFKIKDFS